MNQRGFSSKMSVSPTKDISETRASVKHVLSEGTNDPGHDSMPLNQITSSHLAASSTKSQHTNQSDSTFSNKKMIFKPNTTAGKAKYLSKELSSSSTVSLDARK